jgi:glutathione S-transferase
MDAVQIFGRSSSHYTRLPRIFAHELAVPCELVPILDITAVDPKLFAGNPALKLPILRRGGSALFGSENICRALAELSGRPQRVVWPEQLRSDLARNAHELVSLVMAAQVQIVFGTVVNKLPAENTYFMKARSGLEGALRWLDANLAAVRAEMPFDRELSLFEVTLFCAFQHVRFRGTTPTEPYGVLAQFEQDFGARPSAHATPYRFDAAPSEPPKQP